MCIPWPEEVSAGTRTLGPFLLGSLLLGGLLAGVHPLRAQDTGDEPDAPSLYAGISAIMLLPNPDERLLEPEGRRYGYGVFVGYPLHDRISLNAEFIWLGRDYLRLYDQPQLPNAADNRVRALTIAFLANARVHQPLGPVTVEVGAGVGTGGTSFFISSPDGGGFTTDGGPGDDRSRLTQLLAAVVTPTPFGGRVEIGWRRLWLEHDFGLYSGGPNEFGGDCFYLALRGGW